MRRTLSLFGLLGMLASCRAPSDATTLRSDIRLQPAEVKVGGTTEVTVSITNSGTEDVDVIDPATYCGRHQFRVFDSLGREIETGFRQEVCSLALLAPRPLHPGETAEVTYAWRPSTGPGPADEYTDLPVGQYLIRARAWAAGFVELPGSIKALRITAP